MVLIGIYPFNANAVNYSKIIRTGANPPEISDNAETPCENILHAVLEQIIAGLDDGIIAEFARCATTSDEWDGDGAYAFMYNVWLKCKQETTEHWYDVRVEQLINESDEASVDEENEFRPYEVVEMDGEDFTISDAQIEIVNEADRDRIPAEILHEPFDAEPFDADISDAGVMPHVGLARCSGILRDIVEETAECFRNPR